MANKVVETGLSVTGNSEFGKKLVAAAIEDHKEKTQKAVIGYVQEMMSYLEKTREQITKCRDNEALFEAKIAAIEAGEFSLARTGKITFNDPELEKKAGPGQPTCPNCGFGNPSVRL